MKFEKLNVGDSYGKKMFLYGILVSFFLIILISIFTSRAKYRLTESVKIVDSVVSYSPYDFKIMEIYKQKEDSKCTDITDDTCYEKLSDTERMPSDGYVLNETNSHCDLSDDGKDEEAILTSNEAGEIVISGLTVKDKCYLYYDKEIKAGDTIVANSSVIESDAHFDGPACLNSCTYNENGLYKAEDDFGTSYYFRGSVENNWVKFGKTTTSGNGEDIWWRIIRINGDGSIRLIYTGTGSNAPATNGGSTQINTSVWAVDTNTNNDNMYIGYEWISGNMHGYGEESTKSMALQNLNKWFKENLEDEWNIENGKIDTNNGFCNDRSGSTNNGAPWSENMEDSGGTLATNTYYGGAIRLRSNRSNPSQGNPAFPTFKCSTTYINNSGTINKNKDYFTSNKASGIKQYNTETTITGTKSLTYPVGLITADEVAFAGGVFGTNNTDYWLNTGQNYWTMSPLELTGTRANMFRVGSNGNLTSSIVSTARGLRPVINLKANTKFTFEKPDEPKGTSTNPYIVSN